ncbi:hypothetical protein [Marinimicrobium locisalis]|uniref:hypothetical protein n=1 Tax=Marinimicrobium locisalis TaxID=546022 RepID=UPI0032216A68
MLFKERAENNMKVTLYIMAAIALGVLTLTLLQQNSDGSSSTTPSPEATAAPGTQAKSEDKTNGGGNSLVEKTSLVKPDVDVKKSIDSGEVEEAHEAYSSQMKHLGYHSEEELKSYSHYPVETLEALLNEGDTRAYPVLLEKYGKQGNLEKTRAAAQVAAIHGSTPAIVTLARQAATKADIERNTSANEEVFIHHILFSQALFHLATELGDPFSARAGRDSLERFHIELEQSQKQAIEQLSEKIRKRLNALREDKGFAELEASAEAVNRYHESLLQTD